MNTPPSVPVPGRRRYPGTRPFSDSLEDQRVFFGRQPDVERLYERVLGTRLLVLFGKSGLGKTSLLRAGLFPRLREKAYLPVEVRLNRAEGPADTITAAITQAATRPRINVTHGAGESLADFLENTLIWSGDTLLTPVLVFDQFEEIFTLHGTVFRAALAAELGSLASGLAPMHVAGGHGAGRGQQNVDVKILLSLREEYLGALEDMSAAIPGLFQERVRLGPLSDQGARQAIVEPAAQLAEADEVPFEAPAFDYDEAALQEMLSFLRGDTGIIEPFELQLLCGRVEEDVIAWAQAAKVPAQEPRPTRATGDRETQRRPAHFVVRALNLGGRAGMYQVLSDFYRRTIHRLPKRSRRRARRLCEEGLISVAGSRLMLDATQIESDFGLAGDALGSLVDERLLRCEQRLESLFYEISHDRLAESINQQRGFRIPRTLRRNLIATAITGVVLVVVLTISAIAVTRQRDRAESLIAFLIGEPLLEKLRPVGRNDVLSAVQAEVDEHLRGTADSDRPATLLVRGLALRNEGDIRQSRGELAQAVAKFTASVQTFERLAAAAPGTRYQAEHARSLARLGEVLLDQGKVEDALARHYAALALRDELSRETVDDNETSAERAIQLSLSEGDVGNALIAMGRPSTALRHLNRAVTLLEPLAAASNPQLFRAQHQAFDYRATALLMIGNKEQASADYVQAELVTKRWRHSQPLAADARRHHVIAVSRLAQGRLAQGILAGEKNDSLQKTLSEYQQITASIAELTRWDPSNVIWRRDALMLSLLMVEASAALGDTSAAQRELQAVSQPLLDLAKLDSSDLTRKMDLNSLFSSRGELALANRQWQRAVEDFQAAEGYAAGTAAQAPAHMLWRRDGYWAVYQLARARKDAGQREQAKQLLQRASGMAKALLKQVPEWVSLQDDLATFQAAEAGVFR